MRFLIVCTFSMVMGLLSTPAASAHARAPSPAALLAEVPFTLHQNAVILPAVINERDTVQLLLDTGWGPLALVSTSAKRLGLHPKGSAGDLPRVKVRSFAVGGALLKNASIEVFPSEELEPLIGPHDGVLSTAFFRDLVLQIDYPSKVVRFYSRSPIPDTPSLEPGARVSVPMVFSARAGGLPFTDAVVVDGKQVRALFDTGGSGGFMAMKQMVERLDLPLVSDTSAHIGIGMLSEGKMVQQKVQFVRVGRIALGPLAVDAPRVMVAPSQLEGGDWGHDLNIGYGFMRNYVVTFDYPGKVITFERPAPAPAR